jgi:hypothetical protein
LACCECQRGVQHLFFARSLEKACYPLLYYIMNDHINGSNEIYLFVNGMFIAKYQYSANHLIIKITAMGYIPKPTCSTWRGIFCPSKGGAIFPVLLVIGNTVLLYQCGFYTYRFCRNRDLPKDLRESLKYFFLGLTHSHLTCC